MRYSIPHALTLALLVFCSGPLDAAPAIENPDFTAGESIPKGASHDWNLGPTGARGWMHSHRMETTSARQILITEVATGSPADGLLEKGDVILGIGAANFTSDPRTAFGKAIGRAEASDGKLTLIRWRDGKKEAVTLQLPVLGSYSATAPFSCEKSKRIFEQACVALAKRMKEKPDFGNPITRSYDALALLASGDPQYLPLVRQQVLAFKDYTDPERRSYHSWFYGPITLMVAEYTLATGDKTFLPDLRRLAGEIVDGQSPVGSWGHRFVQKSGRLAGYGMMNAPGVPLTTALVLARKAGVQNARIDQAIEKSQLLLRFYVDKGSIPYGDHHPWIEAHDDNGKNGIAAILFRLTGDTEAAAYFSKMSVASHGGERDTGHTGNFFNLLWAMPGVAIAGPEATGAWMKEFGWHYDLARQWDGKFLHQGPPQARNDSYARWDTTGAYLLAYAQPLKKIYLTGKESPKSLHLSRTEAREIVSSTRGWSQGSKNEFYADQSTPELLAALKTWSPVLRERAALELAKRKFDDISQLTERLQSSDLNTRIGACQALAKLKPKSDEAVLALIETLNAEDLWLRIKAAQALAAIGPSARPAIPKLISMLAQGKSESDPRGMQQRYLSFALFDRGQGLLGNSLEGIDKPALLNAIRAALKNDDGRSRGSVTRIFGKLTSSEIEALLPAIYECVVEPAPSGIMFADGSRMAGLKILAQQGVREAMPLCLSIMDIDAWGRRNRLGPCLEALQLYGASAKPMLPKLREMKAELETRRDAKNLSKEIKLFEDTIQKIESSDSKVDLVPLK